MKLRVSFLTVIAAPAFFFLTIISGTTTSNGSRFFVNIGRNALLALIVVSAILILWRSLRNRTVLLTLVPGGLFLSYGIFLAAATGAIEPFGDQILRNSLVTILGVVTFLKRDVLRRENFLWAHLWFTLLIILLTIASHGLRFMPIPSFYFEYATIQNDLSYDITYSQGITRFFGLAAISTMLLLVRRRDTSVRWFLLTSLIIFTALCALGGARGDAVISGIIILIIAVLNGNRLKQIAMPIGILAIGLALYLPSTVLFTRLLKTASDISLRSFYYNGSMEILNNQPACFLTGCGFSYFQYYNNFEWGRYPHNSVLELIISFGLFLSLVLISLSLIGCRREFSGHGYRLNPIFYFFLFAFMVSLKSGTLISSWVFFSYLLSFAGLGLASLFSKRRYFERKDKSVRIWGNH